MVYLLSLGSALNFVLVTLNGSVFSALAFSSEEEAGVRNRVLKILLSARKLKIVRKVTYIILASDASLKSG